MEYDATRFVGRQPQDLEQMPRNGFSLTVFITREPYKIGLGSLVLQLLDLFLLVLRNLIKRFKAILNIDAERLLVQVTDVTETRHYFIIIAQELLNGLGLGRRLNDN